MNASVFDEHLGPSTERYFGVGYRHTDQLCLNAVIARPAADIVTLVATARIEPWNRRGVTRVTHLGTVDAMAIAVTIGSVTLIAAGRAPAGTECAVESIEVRSGAVAETEVDSIPVHAEWHADSHTAASERIACRIGRLRVTVELRIPTPAGTLLRALPSGPVDVESLLGPRENRYFAEGYRRPELRATTLDLSQRSGTCAFTAEPHPIRFGVVECLALTSQLAQTLLYSAAGVRREQTGNLWMRRCAFSATPADPTAPHRATLDHAALDVTKLVRLDRRTPPTVSAEVRISTFPGWTGVASLAFEVP